MGWLLFLLAEKPHGTHCFQTVKALRGGCYFFLHVVTICQSDGLVLTALAVFETCHLQTQPLKVIYHRLNCKRSLRQTAGKSRTSLLRNARVAFFQQTF